MYYNLSILHVVDDRTLNFIASVSEISCIEKKGNHHPMIIQITCVKQQETKV
jgi:hypothetical protein